MLIKLNKALYGLRDAPKVWFDTIRAFFIMHGFNQSTLDECLSVQITMPKYASKIVESYRTSNRGTLTTFHTPNLSVTTVRAKNNFTGQ